MIRFLYQRYSRCTIRAVMEGKNQFKSAAVFGSLPKKKKQKKNTVSKSCFKCRGDSFYSRAKIDIPLRIKRDH